MTRQPGERLQVSCRKGIRCALRCKIETDLGFGPAEPSRLCLPPKVGELGNPRCGK